MLFSMCRKKLPNNEDKYKANYSITQGKKLVDVTLGDNAPATVK
jgi:hypothetical protein